MLIVTRRPDEAIFIDNDIEVRVLDVKGNQVRLGITAPKSTPVHREEIQKRIEAENAAKGASK